MSRALYLFSAPWCSPCKTLKKMLEAELVGRGDIEVVEIDISSDPSRANEFGVKGVPTMILDGKRQAGVPTVANLRTFLGG